MRIYQGGPMRGYPQYNFNAFEEGEAYLKWLGHDVVSPHNLDIDAGDVFWRGQWFPVHEFSDKFMLRQFDDVWNVGGFNFKAAIARDIHVVMNEGIEAISFLPDWQPSAGAQIEFALGQGIGLPIYEHDPWRYFRLSAQSKVAA